MEVTQKMPEAIKDEATGGNGETTGDNGETRREERGGLGPGLVPSAVKPGKGPIYYRDGKPVKSDLPVRIQPGDKIPDGVVIKPS